ncbi:hypothetical protein [Flavobacterium microcysteis]|uniref:DUF2975 domain-containing protein n=1 Tax=Flavobacterium microcysteis TaxID=2596891 RepID=A0A501PZS8_9FLAO|nr:hypothetical protein [Flavobacterium microcysteis]TPD66079.1 hypothetical protein FJA49_18065 [Flavobacterium microcysteis]
MLIDTFWKLLLKIIGLWLLFGFFSVIPQFFSMISFVDGGIDFQSLLLLSVGLCATIIILVIIIRLFLFKTSWIIEKLKLKDNFKEERIDLTIKSTTVLTIAIIVIGALILIESLPSFCSDLISFLQQKELLKDYPQTGWLIYHFIKIIFGYLLLTNAKNFTKFIEKESHEN